MTIRCIYCGFEVGTGLRCCGVTYALNGTYLIPPERRRHPPMAHGPVSGGKYEDRARAIALRTAPNHKADPAAVVGGSESSELMGGAK